MLYGVHYRIIVQQVFAKFKDNNLGAKFLHFLEGPVKHYPVILS